MFSGGWPAGIRGLPRNDSDLMAPNEGASLRWSTCLIGKLAIWITIGFRLSCVRRSFGCKKYILQEQTMSKLEHNFGVLDFKHGNNSALLDVAGDEDSDEELEDLPLLGNHQDLPFNEVGYYMGGVGGGLGLDTVHHQRLNSLVEEDEPDVSVDGDVNLGYH